MSNARDINPVELALGDVSRSKEAVAAVTKDLDQHNRWFSDYLASEKRSRERHARRVRREEAKQRRRIARQRRARFVSLAVLGLAISVRSISRSLLNGATYRLAQLRDLALIRASGVASTAHAFSSWLLGLLSTGFAGISAKVYALALTSLKATSNSFCWIAAKVRDLTLAALRATSIGCSWIGNRTPALINASFGAASAWFTWTRVKSRDVADASLNAAAIGGSWFAAKTSVLAIASGKAMSSGVSWTRAESHAFALAAREATLIGYAWTTVRTRTLARASSIAISRSLSWSLAESHALALATRRAVSICSAWTTARTSTLAQASLNAASTGSSWMGAKSADVAIKLNHAGSRALPRIKAAPRSVARRLLALSAAARGTARRQSERAFFFAQRLTARAKREIDALRCATRVEKLTPVTRPRFAAIAAPRRGFVSDFHTEEAQKEPKAAHKRADDAIFKTGQHSSSNALICVEPWRCRLPVVQKTRSERSWHKVTNVMGRR